MNWTQKNEPKSQNVAIFWFCIHQHEIDKKIFQFMIWIHLANFWNLPNQNIGYNHFQSIYIHSILLVVCNWFLTKSQWQRKPMYKIPASIKIYVVYRRENEKWQLFYRISIEYYTEHLLKLINEYFVIWNYWRWQWLNNSLHVGILVVARFERVLTSAI